MMSFTPFISAISLAFLFFITMLLVFEKKRSPGSIYLLALLVVLAIVISLRLSFDLGNMLAVYLPFLAFPVGFLYAPLIYLYCESVLFNRSHSPRFFLGLLIMPACAFGAHLYMHTHFPEMHEPRHVVQQTGVIAPYSRIFVGVAALYNLVFLVSARLNLARYNAVYQENFAGNEREQLRWLHTFLFLNLFLVCTLSCGVIVIVIWDLKLPTTPVEGIVALAMIYVILYYFVKRPEIFTLPNSNLPSPGGATTAKYQKQNLSDSERRAYLEKIERYLTDEKPFLDDKVTLASLARELGIPAHHFSMVINIEKNMNFYNFINFYRVQEAKALLADKGLAHETVLDIGLMAGFQSKAGFNKVFKEITGATPSAYREAAGTRR